VLLLGWWLVGSRRPSLVDRVVGAILVVAAATATYSLIDRSVLLGLMVFGTLSVISVLTLWFLLSQRFSWRTQRIGAVVLLLGTLGLWCALRGEGVNGVVTPEFSWRWSPTAEEEYVEFLANQLTADVASVDDDEAAMPAVTEDASGDWIGFRGRDRDGRLSGVRIETDWEASPPQQLWRRPIGPAWSSFTVIGDRVYTQEQRGDQEVVLCLDAESGQELWAHMDETRFWEAMAGAGPRATPSFDQGRIYATGANGNLNCLDATTGDLIWSRNIGVDGERGVPEWGFASSPLIVDETVMVYAGGGDGKGILAYNKLDGELLWRAGDGTHSYSSPQLVTIAGTPQVLMQTERGVFSINPESGELLWSHEWLVEGMNRSVQPNVAGDLVFLGTGFGLGTRAVSISRQGEAWDTMEQWTSRALKPYYNDFVIHDGYLYGFDGNIFACADVENGQRQWKRGRYGNGQVLLIADQGLLLVLSEKGEVVILKASPEQLEELARLPAVTGKTWNHPVIAHGKLFVRNAEEAACFSLPLVDSDRSSK
jgi:outer membrane protein assembly factor BamB